MSNNYFEDGKMKTIEKTRQIPTGNGTTSYPISGEYKEVVTDYTTAGTNDKTAVNNYSQRQAENTKAMESNGFEDRLATGRKISKLEELAETEEFKNPNTKSYLTSPDKLDETSALIQKDQEEARMKMLENFIAKEKEYLVRGALIKCRCGSHHRKLNLPTSHGVFFKGKPQMNASDSIPGDSYNIPTFGVCSSKANTSGGSILLVADVKRDMDGNEIGPSSGNVRGIPCSPIIVSKWLNEKEDFLVGEDNAILVESFLVCKYEGLIEVVNSGQEL